MIVQITVEIGCSGCVHYVDTFLLAIQNLLYLLRFCSDNFPYFCDCFLTNFNAVALVRERTIPTERPPLVGEVVPTFADKACGVVSATDSHGR
jgi:hypothetical protein